MPWQVTGGAAAFLALGGAAVSGFGERTSRIGADWRLKHRPSLVVAE